MYIEEGAEREELTAALHSEGYSPVYLDQKTCDLHYNGFCNSVLWQLFHYSCCPYGPSSESAASRPPAMEPT